MKITLLIALLIFSNTRVFSQNTETKGFDSILGREDNKTISWEPYKADWKSLYKHKEAPDWLRDGKLGIYFHWGVYSVPANGEWFIRGMYSEKGQQKVKEKYGDNFNYEDFIPMFKAENFDPEAWAKLFKKSGAAFAGPVVIHHDGFAMWDSEVTPWNAADMGPQRDLTGELEKTIKQQGLKFITTFHHATNGLYVESKDNSLKYPEMGNFVPRIDGTSTTSEQTDLRLLYGDLPQQEFIDKLWYPTLIEVIDKYEPDAIWFDWGLKHISDYYKQHFLAYYLNQAHQLEKEVAIFTKHYQVPPQVSVLDFEKSLASELQEEPWLTDDVINYGAWGYKPKNRAKPVKYLVCNFIDIVSKNGHLLLNISPKADGTIPQDQQEALLGIGAWLEEYGEAIYSTRPWKVYGQTEMKMVKTKWGGYAPKGDFTEKEVRYTTKGDALYAITLGQPSKGSEIILKDFSTGSVGEKVQVNKISMLGNTQKVKWTIKGDGLHIVVPKGVPSEIANVFVIE